MPFLRLLCLAGLAALVAYAATTEDKRGAGRTAVLGSGDSLADVVSGTYGRPQETRRKKAKVQLASVPSRIACKKNGSGCQSRKNKGTDFAGNYRTLCVRLCDGYYFPISSAATPKVFERDEQICSASCSSPARLFVYKNTGGTPETMADLEGNAYADLVTAFKYRVAYDSSCTCTPKPWTEEAANRHRLYALEDAAAKGDGSAALEKTMLAAVVKAQEQQARLRSGADLVTTAALFKAKTADATASRKTATKRTAVVRVAVPSRHLRAARAVSLTRSLRSGATFAVQRRARMPVRGLIRFSESRVVVRVTR